MNIGVTTVDYASWESLRVFRDNMVIKLFCPEWRVWIKSMGNEFG